ncbi:MAG: Fe-S cluster assembly protein SufB [archaeon]
MSERFDHKNEETPDSYIYKAIPGLTEELIREISKQKNEPEWMLQKRLKGLAAFNSMPLPSWGPDLAKLDFSKITFFARPNAAKNAKQWEDVPEKIKQTFERLGIPEAERKALSGVGAQYESEVVYHNLKKEWEDQGVIFLDMDEALHTHPELVKHHFMTNCVPITDHKFAALHAAVWSGGTFLYVPKGVHVSMPLQAYFRMNAAKMGQFEHTLIIIEDDAQAHYIEGCSAPQYNDNSLHAGCVEIYVKKNARMRYSSVENWSRNTYNLNTKRAIVEENGIIEWVNGNLGSCVTLLYPCSILKGKGARADFLGIAMAGKGQNQDTGAKVFHLASHTSSTITSKSISKDGGITSYRGILRIAKTAKQCTSSVQCDALMIDAGSQSNTYPVIAVQEEDAQVVHEATVGRIGPEQIFYLQSRGLSEQEAKQMIVSGFIEPIVKELPLEYAVELNRLIELEMEGSLG